MHEHTTHTRTLTHTLARTHAQEVEIAIAKLEGRDLPPLVVPPKVFDGLPDTFSFYDPRISLGAWQAIAAAAATTYTHDAPLRVHAHAHAAGMLQTAEPSQKEGLCEFFKALALTHTVRLAPAAAPACFGPHGSHQWLCCGNTCR